VIASLLFRKDNLRNDKYYRALREEMVNSQIIARGIKDERIIEAMRTVGRHLFVPENMRSEAYNDYPLPIGQGQTISQPYIVALMTELPGFKGNEKVLEIGTGSGYQTAILARLAAEVYTVERISELLEGAKKRLTLLGYKNIHFFCADGTKGLPEYAPYQGIIATAAAEKVPFPYLEQLDENSRLVIPVGGRYSQVLVLIERKKGKIVQKEICGCTFVPLIGEYGYKEE